MSSKIPSFSEQDVKAAVRIPEVIDSLERTLGHEAAGTAWNMDKSLATWPERSSAHALGAIDTDENLVVFKTWVNTPVGATAIASAFNARDGQAVAIFEAAAFGSLRTASISALATRLLSDPGADEMTIVGGGRQGLSQVQAVAAVRALTRVRVWSPNEERREAFGRRIRDDLGLTVTVAKTLEEATADSPIVTVITRASDPFLHVEHLAHGSHLNAVGAVLPANAEFFGDVLPAADAVVVDSIENTRRASREFGEHYGENWSGVSTLADVVAGKTVRPTSPRLTLFKSMGMGLSDLAVARLLLRKTGTLA